jgi:fatty-acyl-CoA synthase
VLAAAVVAKPDSKWGETPCAFVELKAGAKTSEAELIEFCRERRGAVWGIKMVAEAIPNAWAAKAVPRP